MATQKGVSRAKINNGKRKVKKGHKAIGPEWGQRVEMFGRMTVPNEWLTTTIPVIKTPPCPELPKLLIVVRDRMSHKLVRVIEIDDPRGDWCEHFNEFTLEDRPNLYAAPLV